MSDKLTIIPGGVAADDRGSLRFINDFNPTEAGVKRFYQVQNHASGFVRAWHGHVNEGKYVYVPKGAAVVAAAKMIKSLKVPGFQYKLDETSLQKLTLADCSPKVVFIPPGYANGFKTLTEDTVVMFFSTSSLEESKGDDIRFAWNEIQGVWEEDYR